MKKFVSVVLAIIMVGLVVLLCINISIKSMAAKTVSNAVVANETTDQIQQVITENFPNVTDDQIQQIQEVISTSSSINSFTDDLLNQITEATLNGEQVDTASIMNQLSQVFVDNVAQIEQVIDQDITDEQIQIVQERLTDQNGALQTKINEVVDSVQSGSTNQIVDFYNYKKDGKDLFDEDLELGMFLYKYNFEMGTDYQKIDEIPDQENIVKTTRYRHLKEVTD